MASATADSSSPKTFRVGIICGSQRVVRAGPQIAGFVRSIIEEELKKTAEETNVSIALEDIDIATVGLPLYDESGVPSQIRSADGYDHAHTRAWSRRIAALDGFVFVVPQYNWSFPAGLKNAIDYLFHEWKGKPAAIVSYGGHGGGKAAAALATVLGGGLDMRLVAAPPVALAFPSRDVLYQAARGEDLHLGDTPKGQGIWDSRREEIAESWAQLVKLLTG